MKNFSVRLYQKSDFEIWNTFVSEAKNATFLFHRNFMEYHSNRFVDYSLMVFDFEKLVAVLPANRVEAAVFSHQGLTYGGLVFDKNIKLSVVISILKSVLFFLNQNKIEKIVVKIIPSFYNDFFSNELEYCLFAADAKLIQIDSMSTIDLKKPFFISKTRKESIRRGEKNGLIIKEEFSFDVFWNEILIPNLERKHQAKPVHTLAEITYLKSNFPENIRQFNVYDGKNIVAGTTVFVSKNVAHPQYVSGNINKNELGSLDYLYHHLIKNIFAEKAFFDFGISNENQGKNINAGLLFWKESFGAQTVVQRSYEIQTSNFELLENVLL